MNRRWPAMTIASASTVLPSGKLRAVTLYVDALRHARRTLECGRVDTAARLYWLSAVPIRSAVPLLARVIVRLICTPRSMDSKSRPNVSSSSAGRAHFQAMSICACPLSLSTASARRMRTAPEGSLSLNSSTAMRAEAPDSATELWVADAQPGRFGHHTPAQPPSTSVGEHEVDNARCTARDRPVIQRARLHVEHWRRRGGPSLNPSVAALLGFGWLVVMPTSPGGRLRPRASI